MAGQVTRWGIAGAGNISSLFATALTLLPPSDHKLMAIASRSQSRSDDFSKKFTIPNSYGSYEDLAADNDIDVVYLGVITTSHLPLIKLYLNCGRHVLCEKPLTVNTRQAREAVALAREKGLFLMEGFWSRFFPVYNDLRRELSSGGIGEVKIVNSSFGSEMPKDKWFYDRKLGGGALMSVGCYCVMISQLVYNQEKPDKIQATAVMDENGLDDTVSVTLTYSSNRVATIIASKANNLPNHVEVYGTKGTIKIPRFLCPEEITINGETTHHPVPPPEPIKGKGFVYQAQSIRECILKGLTENPLMTWNQTIQIQEILEEIRNQIGLVYEDDIIN